MDGESTTSLPVSRKERGTVLEESHLPQPPLPGLPNKSCRTLKGVGSCCVVVGGLGCPSGGAAGVHRAAVVVPACVVVLVDVRRLAGGSWPQCVIMARHQ